MTEGALRGRRRRILHVIPVLWSGAGEVVARLCERQAETADVRIATSAYRGPQRDWRQYRRRLLAAGVRHVQIDTFSRDPQTLWSAVGQIAQAIETWRPTLIHTHAGVPAVAVALAQSRERRVPHVAHMYSWGPDRPAWMDAMDLWGFAQADQVVCSARKYEQLLKDGGVDPKRLSYVPWGVAIDRVDRARLRPRRAGDCLTLGTVGRIEPRKGQLELVRAFAQVRRRLPAAGLEFVGPVADTAYAARCRAEVTRLGLGAHVTWRGYARDVHRVVASWQLYLSLSTDEGQGLAVQEAMAAGVPVVAVAAPGVEDFLVDGRTGFCVQTRTPREVARAAVRVLASPAQARRVALAGSRLVRSRYSWARCFRQMDAIYRRALHATVRRA